MQPKPLTKTMRRFMNWIASKGGVCAWHEVEVTPDDWMADYFTDKGYLWADCQSYEYKLTDKGRLSQRTGQHQP